jgi:PAS domain S-box-containing protein
MRIKKRLQINFALSLVMAFVIFLLLSMSLYSLNKANNLEKIVDEIKSGAFERVAFRNDYTRNNSARAKEQWYAKHEQVGRFLESAMANSRSAGERKDVAGLIEAHEAIGRIFSAIVANRDRSSLNPGSAALSREVEERLVNQLDMRVYEVAILSRQLLKLSTEERDSAFRLTGWGVLSALLILVASAMLNSWTLSRTVTSPMLRLRDSATVIGEGNLDHRIDVKGDDEFSEISEAFNAMATNLRRSYGEMEKEIAERKQAVEAVKQSHKTLAELIERSPFGTYIVDSQFRIALMNASTQENAFRNVRPVIGRNFAEAMRILWPEPVAAEIIGHFRHTLDTGEPYYSRDFVKPRHDAEIVEAYEWELHHITLPDGQYGVICYYYDSTKLREAEEALRESEERMQQALSVSRSFAFEWDPAADRVLRSDSCAAILKLTGDEARHDTGKSYFARLHPDDRARFVQMLHALTPSADTYRTEYRVVRGDDSTVVLEEVAQASFDDTGKFERLVGVTTDITERKLAEDALKASLLEKEVLLKEIHHRVKNNMQVISSLVALQADQLQDAGMRAILDEMAQRVRSMAMVHEKLYQSHDLAGVEFSDYARSLLNYLWRSHATAASAVRLTLDLEPVSLTVNTAVPCGLILNELVSNALKHAFRGRNGGEVTVSLHSAKGGIRLSIRDDGTGLPAGFDWKQTKSLGLRLVQMLAGQLHADVEVSSDRGTEFTITFGEPKT